MWKFPPGLNGTHVVCEQDLCPLSGVENHCLYTGYHALLSQYNMIITAIPTKHNLLEALKKAKLVKMALVAFTLVQMSNQL